MGTYQESNGGISLMEAVEALSAIAETHWEQEKSEFAVEEEMINLKDPHWLYSKDEGRSREMVKELFKTVLNHLKQFYQSEYTLVTDSKTLEGIKTIMVLVGEAAKKIDHYTTLFKSQHEKSATKLHEYKQLQDFYKKNISRTIDESLLGKWLLALTQRTWLEHKEKHVEGMRSLETRHVFVDLESLKQDKDYELFFVRKEDGSRFFNPRIVRNMKLIADFGTRLSRGVDSELFIDQKIWEDKAALLNASAILKEVEPILQLYYTDLVKDKDLECQGTMNMALMALYLASNSQRLLASGSAKPCMAYFSDFQHFLRDVLDSRDFQKIVAYPYEDRSKSQEATLKIVQALLRAIYSGGTAREALGSYWNYLYEEAYKIFSQEHIEAAYQQKELWSFIASDQAALKKLLKNCAHESLGKILDNLEEGTFQQFDPWMQGCLPECLLQFTQHGVKRSWIGLPSPTKQEYIHEAKVTEEFMGYLNAHKPEEGRILIINYQDRTNWHEHARAKALEGLEEMEGFKPFLDVVTLPKDTEFYWQEIPYSDDHQAQIFKDHLMEHLIDNLGGFYFSDAVREKMPGKWFRDLIEGVHQFFFVGRNVLAKEARLDFIEIVLLLIELKLCEVSNPVKVFAVCKDGVDVVSSSTTLLGAYLSLIREDMPSIESREEMRLLLQPAALLGRRRGIQQDRFDRMLGALKTMESVQKDLGAEEFRKQLKNIFGPYVDPCFVSR